MDIKKYINKNYLIYGLSIIFSRGFELIVLFIASLFLVKSQYGQLEYYKKIIELGGAFLSLGFPTLIMTYPRSKKSKLHLLVFSVFTILLLAVLLSPVLFYYKLIFLLIPILFYSFFFTGGVLQSYLLVQYDSQKVSIYKILVSLLFFSGVLFVVLKLNDGADAYVYPAYFLFPLFFIFVIKEIFYQQFRFNIFKKYAKHFVKLLYGSFTLLLNNFSNLMFIYTDIFLIKYLSENAFKEIADYSFALNVSNILLIIPLTLIQVDIEKLKTNYRIFNQLQRKILVLVGVLSLVLLIVYFGMIHTVFDKYNNTFLIFIILLIAKIFQSSTVIYGASLIIKKKFNHTLFVNLLMILINIIASYLLYSFFGLYGIAIASMFSLMIRLILLRHYRVKFYLKTSK